MIQKIKSLFIGASSLILLAMPLVVPVAVSAAAGSCNAIANNVATGVNAAAGPGSDVNCGNSNVGTGSITHLAQNVVKFFSIIVGAVSVIMIIYGGFRYITSGGESGRVGNAKNTLIYAIIGLIIVALAQLIVHFVLNQASNVESGTTTQ